MIVQPQKSTITDFKIKKLTKTHKIVSNDDKPTKLYIKLTNNEVKFTPKTYDRLVIELNEENLKYMNDVYNHLKQFMPLENMIKNEIQLSLKINKNEKDAINEELNPKDIIDVVICLDQVYTMNKLNYMSVELYQYKKQEPLKMDFL